MDGLVLDLIVLAVILGNGIRAWKCGFVRAALGFLPPLAAVLGSKLLSPYTGRFLRGTSIFQTLSTSIRESMGLDQMIQEGAMATQTELITSMRLPAFLKEALLENNNPVIYQLLDVSSLKEYIAGYLANICINILSVAITFLVISIAAGMLLQALHLVTKLPVLHFVNHAAGLAVGSAKGVLFIWIAGMGLTFLQCQAKLSTLFAAMDSSLLAKFFYEHNLLLQLILTIFT